MILHCGNRKCNTTTDHKIRVATNEAVCMNCNEVNDNVSDIMKKTMKDMGNVLTDVSAKKSFTFKCSKCNLNRGVKFLDERAVCDTCSHPLHLSAAMTQAVRQTGNYTMGSATEAPTEQEAKAVVKKKKA